MGDVTTVLFTACCGRPTCDTIRSIAIGSNRRYRIVGVDCAPVAAARNYVDALYSVPEGKDSHYVASLLDICVKEKVDVLVPLVCPDILPIWQSLDKFDEIGVAVALTKKDGLLETARDKMKLYDFLNERGIDVMPKSIRFEDHEGALLALSELGYPNPVCIKPTDGGGASGFKIIDDEKAVTHVPDRSSVYITVEQFLRSVPHLGRPYVMQEYVPGYETFAQCLVDHGRVVYALVQRNFDVSNSIATYLEYVEDPEVVAIVTKVCELLKLDGNIGFDLKRTPDGRLVLLECNARVAAGAASAAAGGINLVEMGIRHALGEEIEEGLKLVKGLRVKRLYQSLYEINGKPFLVNE